MSSRRNRATRRYTLDEIWLNFYATDALEWRNRLLLHYLPIVKFTTSRVISQTHPTRVTKNPLAVALIALGRAIDERPHGELDDFTPTVIQTTLDAVIRHVTQ